MGVKRPRPSALGYSATWPGDPPGTGQQERAALALAGCSSPAIEPLSEPGVARPLRNQLVESLAPGDLFAVTALHRAAGSTGDLRDLWSAIGGKGAHLVVLDGSLDTREPRGAAMVRMLEALSAFEGAIADSTKAARKAVASAEGRRVGRKATARDRSEEVVALQRSGVGPEEIVRRTGLGRSSVYRILRGTGEASSKRDAS